MDKTQEIIAAEQAWTDARKTAAIEYEAWQLLQSSRKLLLAGFKGMGMTGNAAKATFDKHMEDHLNRYSASLEYLAKTSEDLRKLLGR